MQDPPSNSRATPPFVGRRFVAIAVERLPRLELGMNNQTKHHHCVETLVPGPTRSSMLTSGYWQQRGLPMQTAKTFRNKAIDCVIVVMLVSEDTAILVVAIHGRYQMNLLHHRHDSDDENNRVVPCRGNHAAPVAPTRPGFAFGRIRIINAGLCDSTAS
jgi:hypothetical protein